jgi:hypothetical protein
VPVRLPAGAQRRHGQSSQGRGAISAACTAGPHVGRRRNSHRTLALRLGAGPVELHQALSEAVLDAVKRVNVVAAFQAGHQLAEGIGQALERPRRRFDRQSTNETVSPMTVPSVTSNTRSTADAIGVACVIVGTSSTIAAVIGPAVKLCLIAAISASGPTAMASPASSATWLSWANQNADDASVNRTADGARQIIDRRLQRPADADLREDDRGEHRPDGRRISSHWANA